MTVKDVITEAAYMVGETDFAKTFAAGGEVDADKRDAFLRCFNLTLHETAVEYLPIRKTVAAKGGKVAFSSFGFSVLRVVGVYGAGGESLDFKVFPSYIVTPPENVTVVFDAAPVDMSVDDEFVYDKTRIGKRVFACGVASEYCLQAGRFSEAENFGRKYRAGAEGEPFRRGGRMRPLKRWGL